MGQARILAWALGVGAVAACVVGAIVCIGVDAPRSFLLDYMNGVLLAVLGALIAVRQPRNSVGWLMIVFAWLASSFQAVSGYGYAALGVHHGDWPLGSVAAWMGAWLWIPVVGFIAPLAVRFPNGHRGRFGGLVDWVYLLGTALFAIPVALAPPSNELQFSALPSPRLDKMLPYFHDPSPVHISTGVLLPVQAVAIGLILLASVVAAISLFVRYRDARGDERLQIKWLAYAGALCAAAVVFGGVAATVFKTQLYLAFTPLQLTAVSIPAAIGVAVLRYRLYEIDLLINRTLVYGGLTAFLGAVYAATITLLNRLFISVSGQKSDAAYVVTAFVVVVAASPVKDWLQRQVDRRVRHASPAAVLNEFRADVDAVVSVIDVARVARRLVDEAAEAFDARGAALYLDGSDQKPAYSRGHLNGDTEIEVALHYEDREFGRLVLGSRRGDVEYTTSDRAVLQQSADSVGEALALAAQLGFKPLAKIH